ncbi:Oidioi.mRNA.OKI2018_I69.PAR.g9689.t1.cds [Oikopleura dioica]|uniref:Oidioi.mRNA.OKI2018_I69.PAR.g9689.t1.cds n=1 Tax=Oikopleura dioica TaxID=34765 RepID=A0ABN7RQW6_OIKDI|nr:Oidioi.mRNA.OKI2018_I69.PAR.g9689.t1.cds [Oikopleura dioica]
MLLLVNYGLIVGVYYAVSTLLSQLLSHEAATVGLMGALMVITGLFGSVLGGILLDKTKAFKKISLVFYVFTLICCSIFTGVLMLGNKVTDFVLIGVLGFFMTGYLPIGFEFAAELTYPEPEAISSGLLNWAGMTFGLVTTQICQIVIVKLGIFPTCGIMIGMLVIGLCLLFAIKEDLRRHQVEQKT